MIDSGSARVNPNQQQVHRASLNIRCVLSEAEWYNCSMPNQHTKNPVAIDVRFWRHVDKNGPVPAHRKKLGPCWPWTGKRTRYGYGLFCHSHAKAAAAHRFAYELVKGPLAPGMDCCHACDNRACCRPSHLFEGTRSQNLRDGAAKGLFTCGERNGQAKITDAQVNEIRHRYATGMELQREIAADFGITRSMVSYIVSRKSWAHVKVSRSAPERRRAVADPSW